MPPPLVLLHGFAGGPESWRPVLDHLTASRFDTRVIAPHLAGHGEHPEALGVAPHTHDFEAEVDRLADVCRDQDVDAHNRAVLVGYSLGARLGLGLLVRHPHLFRRAILVGVNPGLETAEARSMRREHDEALAQRAERDGLEVFLAHWQALPLFGTQARLPTAVLDQQSLVRRSNTAQGLALSLRTCGLGRMPDYGPHLDSVVHPVALVAGRLDERFVALAQHLSAVLPRASLHLVPKCGHNVPLEAPASLSALIQTGS